MKYFLLLLSLGALSMAQRPTYAGTSAKGYPELASRFADPDALDSSNQATVESRLGDPDSSNQKIPVDARGDAALVNRLNQWPRENRPFWLINVDHIENQRRTGATGNQLGSRQNQQEGISGNVQPRDNQLFNQANNRQIQSRFQEPVGSEFKTIKPLNIGGVFAGTPS